MCGSAHRSDSESESDTDLQHSKNPSSSMPEVNMHRLLALPVELQDLIFSYCDQWTLFSYALLNKSWNRRITPKLWRNIDFADRNDVENSRRLFAICDKLTMEKPARAQELMGCIESLRVGRLYGLNILYKTEPGENFDYWEPPYNAESRNRRYVFDIIANMPNLRELSVYVKSWWGFGYDDDEDPAFVSMGAKLQKLEHLTNLELGGQMSDDVLRGLLGHAEQIRHLTLINLHETPGQDHGPEGAVFLNEELAKRLTSLETLNLCKLADLHWRPEDEDSETDDDDEENENRYASGMWWAFPRESETEMLDEWVLLLRHTSHTIQHLTLQNRYLCCYGFDNNDIIEPGSKPGSENWGANSIQKSQAKLFPLLQDKHMGWERLKKLTLVGMGLEERVNAATGWLRIERGVEVVQEPAVVTTMGGDVTPMDVSTPYEFHDTED